MVQRTNLVMQFRLKTLNPQMAGMVVKAGATTFSRSGNYNPVDVPAGTGNITVYFSYIDDKTPTRLNLQV